MGWTELAFTTAALFLIVTIRYVLFAGAAYLACYRWRRTAWHPRKIQPKMPEPGALRQELLWSLSSGGVFAVAGVAVLAAWQGGYSRLYADPAEHGWAWLLLSVPAMMLVHETYFYWTHRWMHRPSLYRRMHRVHHLSRNPSPWAAFAFHPYEAVVEAAILPLLVLAMPVHIAAFLLYLMIMTVLSVINHMGYELYPAGFDRHWFWKWWISSTHHNLHHSRMRTNYGLYFTFWDRLMGTEDPSYPALYSEVKARLSGDGRRETGDGRRE